MKLTALVALAGACSMLPLSASAQDLSGAIIDVVNNWNATVTVCADNIPCPTDGARPYVIAPGQYYRLSLMASSPHVISVTGGGRHWDYQWKPGMTLYQTCTIDGSDNPCKANP